MKHLFQLLIKRLGISSERTKNIAKHIGWSLFFKIGSVIANFLIVPLTINYLGDENYGIWLTLSSFITWFSLFDIGLGHGLRNKFTEAKYDGDFTLARAYVSSAYFAIGIISMSLIFLFFIGNNFIEWSSVFNTQKSLDNDLSILMLVVFSFFCLQLVFKLITTVHQANQNHSIGGKIEFIYRFFSLLAIWFLLQTNGKSLVVYGCIFAALPVVILLVFNFLSFSTTYKEFKPTLSLFKWQYIKQISGIGLSFFIVQIAVLVLFTTDNFIITKLFEPKEVVPYNIALKYFNIILTAHIILVSPYWSSITEAFGKKDYDWIKNSVKKLQTIWLSIPIFLIIMLALSDWFYKLWIGDHIKISLELSASMALYIMAMTFQSIYVQFLNGTGKIRIQLYINIFSLVINIPLSIFFAKNLNLGLSGIILSTTVCLMFSVIILPIQYHKIINNKATGIWDK